MRPTGKTAAVYKPGRAPLACLRIANDPIQVEPVVLRDIHIGDRKVDHPAAIDCQRVRRGGMRADIAKEKHGRYSAGVSFSDEDILRLVPVAVVSVIILPPVFDT